MPKKHYDENLFEKIIDDKNLYYAYLKSRKGKGKYKIEAIKFAMDETYNLRELKQSLIDETYQFEGYIEFPVFEPKERIINAPHYKDKIVQLAINNVLKEVYNPCFIYDSYACIDEKGTHKCVDRISKFMRKAKWQYGESAYIIKIDIKKFFYTMDRNILKGILRKKIRCKKTLWLLDKIIDSASSIDELGLPLGNTLSQLCANIYMNELDQYCKRKLGLKYYIRYVDDILVIVKDKEEAKPILNLITTFLNEKLHLKINKKKTKTFPINQGINTIGFKIHATHRLLRTECKKKIKRKTKVLGIKLIEGRTTVRKVEQILNSWLGHAKHGSTYNFIIKLLKDNTYLCFKDKKTIKVVKENTYGNRNNKN